MEGFPTNLIQDFCIVWNSAEGNFLLICIAVKRQLSKTRPQPKSTTVYWARRAAGFVINEHAVVQVWCVLHCPAFHSSPVSFSMCVPPLSAGRRGVTWCAEEDKWHAGGDSEEDGQPVQTWQHLHHWRTAPGWAQLCHQQVRWVFFLHLTVLFCVSTNWFC